MNKLKNYILKMDYTVRHIAENRFQINLVPANKEEHSTIQRSSDAYLQTYYEDAVQAKLGTRTMLTEILDDSLKPYSIIGKVEGGASFPADKEF
ncbi:MAG: hypothetical protein HYU70_13075 [Bacteroidetes bacterium]|nr:hypothetical protein [Bacteroidota bacterium]